MSRRLIECKTMPRVDQPSTRKRPKIPEPVVGVVRIGREAKSGTDAQLNHLIKPNISVLDFESPVGFKRRDF